MLRRILLSLTTSLFIFTNVIASYAFHTGGSGALTAQTDTQSGSASFAVPIDVPPGRAGIQPNIQLRYSSSLPNGLLGVGWSLEFGSIQRSAKNGVPSYTDSDTFVLVQSGSGQELVFDAAAGFYRAETEGAFMKTEFINNSYWRVTDKKGTRYYFGEDQAAREYDPANTARVFKWALNRVEDLNGNTMTTTYWRDGNRLYPQYIDYTANPQNLLSSFARVEFLWSSRSDTMGGYTAGFLMETNYRLSRVNAWIGTNLQYRFDLTYHASNATNRSLLDTITQYGVDGLSALPPLTFLYQEYVNQSVPAYSAVTTPLTNSSTSNNQFFGDFNGDGRADRALYDQSAGNLQVALSTGAGFQSPSVWYGNFASGVKFLSGNFDSDGGTDLCVFNPSSGNWDVFSSNGQNQFVSKGTWIFGFGANQNPGTGDFNADGLPDIVTYYEQAGDWRARVALNKGGRFEIWTARDFIIGVARTGEDDYPFAADFNGDGLTDFGSYAKTSGNWRFAMHPGSLDKNFEPLVMIPNFGNTRNFIVSDIDSDGLTDIGYYYGDVQKVIYRLSTGKTFANEQSLFLGWNVPAVQSVDFNGDGLPDFVPVETGAMKVNYSSGVFPDLLDTSDNGVGGTTTIEYAPSTNFNNPKLPFSTQMVKSASQSNSRGDVYTTRYDYAQGLWDGAQREFRGFGSVKVTDPNGNYMETDLLQDEIFHGRVVEQRAFDSSQNLFSKTKYTWSSSPIAAGVNFVFLQRKDNFVLSGNDGGRRTAEEFFYEEIPQLGNLTRVVQYGEVDLAAGNDIPGDDRSIETMYVNNISGSNWLAGLPRLTTVKNQSQQIMRQSWFYYDNQAGEAVPVKGLLTKKEDWAGTGSVNPVTQYSYDAIGNLSTTTDPKGNITRVTYDTTYNMFPLTTENALAHKVTNEYFGVNGVPLLGTDGLSGLWGQVKSATDPNQQQGKRSYDAFGRLTTTIGPLDSLAYPTQTTEIQYNVDYTKVTGRQRVKSGQAQTIDTISFYDGLGRLIQAKTPSEVLGRYVVGGQAEYDSRGLKNKQYLSYFSTNLADTIEPINSTGPRSTIEYDAMGRPVKTINPDGTYASVIYDDWTTAAVDANGHKQASYFDAYSRLIKKEEYTGADGRSPNYSASPYALYAATLYSYDSEGNLVQTKDAYNNTTTITYDVLGRKTAMTDPDMGAWSYQYDLNGNLTKQIDAKGQTLTFTYDVLNRLTNKTDGVNGTVNVNYTYDNATPANFAKGRLTQAAYTGGNTQFAYDELGRELQSIKAMNTTNYSVNRSYDALNNLLQIQYPDQKNIYYKYNAAGQIEMIANGQLDDPVSSGLVFLESPFTHFKLNDNAGTKTVADTGTGANSGVASVNTDILSTAGHINSAFQFNGTDQYVNADGLLADIINDNAGSFTMWLKPANGGILLSFAGPGGYLSMEWAQGSQAVIFTMSGSSTPLSCITPTGSSPSGVYTHVAFVQDGIGLKIYINGVEQPLSYWAVANKGAWFNFSWAGPITNGRIGAYNVTSDPLNNAGFFQGGMDDLRYHKKALTASEVSAIYNKGLGIEDSMVSYTLSMVDAQEGPTTMLAQAVSPVFKEDPALFGPLSLNLQLDSTSSTVLGASGNHEVQTVLLTIASWFERHVLGVGEAEAAPIAPVLNTATAGNARVSLGWGAVSGATGYKVKYGKISGGGFGTKDFTKDVDCVAGWKFNETSGTVTDSCKARHGTVSGTLTRGVAGKYNSGIEFLGYPSGNNAYVNFGSDVSLDNLRSRTLVAWIKLDTLGDGSKGTIFSKNHQDGWVLRLAANNNIAFSQAFSGGVVTWTTTTNAVKMSTWQHVAVTYTGSGTTAVPVIYLNGVAQAVSGTTPFGTIDNDAAYNLVLGIVETTQEFDGRIDEAAVFKRVLTSAEIAGIMNNRLDGGVGMTYETQLDVGNVFSYAATGLTNGTTYYFVVLAKDAAGESLNSNERSATPVALPATPVLSAPAAGDKQVTLSWAAATGATGYKIYYGTAAGVYGTPISVGNVTTSTVTGLANGTTYYFAVSGTNTSGEGLRSSEKSAMPSAPMTENPALFVKNVDYNASGQMTRIEYGNGDVTTYTYNPLNLRLTRLYTVDKNGAAVQDLNYTYDSAGNILSITDNVNTSDQTFKYDELNRLVEAVNPNPGSYGTKSYVYDKIGNIVSKDNKTYFYGGANGGPHAVTSLSDGTAFTYDANGNMVTKVEAGVTTNYTYDAENRLTKVVKNGSTIGQYEYDGDGGRTKKTATVSGATTTTTFVGSLFETSGSRTTKFIFLGGQRVAAVTNSPALGSTTLYYHADHLGGANVLTDSTGFKKELIEYEPFGLESRHEKYGSSEEVAWYYFTGKKTDDESGLIYFGARYYDPKLGRFITPDTIVQNPYDPQSLNRYSYTSNNPINRIDPDGHKWSWGKFWKSVGIAIVGITLTVMSAGTLTPVIGAYWAGVAGGALAGATIGGTFAAATGGNIGMGLLTGAVGGGLFAGLAPGLGAFSDGIFRGISLGGAAGPLTSGASMASNFTAGFLGGAASGAAVAGVGGGDVGQAALIGGAIAGGFSLGRDTALLMRAETARSSSLDPLGRNTNGKSVGFNGDGKKYAGARYNPNNSNAWPAPLGGHQGGQGKIFGFNYPPGFIVDRVFEAYAGPHDWLNGWTYDSMGNLRNLNIAEGFMNTFTNPLNVAIATPIVASSVIPRGAYAAPSIIYGETHRDN